MDSGTRTNETGNTETTPNVPTVESNAYDWGTGYESVNYVSEKMTISTPQYIGHWTIVENLRVFTTKKPNVIHRYVTKLLLGWEWKNGK